MAEFVERYINPFTDYGFKKLFGEEPNKERIFEKLFESAEIARFTPDQVRSYEDSLKYYRDLKNSLDTARKEGIQEGMEKGIIEGIEKGIEKVAANALKMGKSMAEIMELTGLTREQIEKLK